MASGEPQRICDTDNTRQQSRTATLAKRTYNLNSWQGSVHAYFHVNWHAMNIASRLRCCNDLCPWNRLEDKRDYMCNTREQQQQQKEKRRVDGAQNSRCIRVAFTSLETHE